MQPIFSIITIVYNGKSEIEKTIKSVINQTYKNFEYIVIDGGSTDGTKDVIEEYRKFIDIYISEKDEGIYYAMNKGIKIASGEWINFLNCGDTYYNEKVLENIINEDIKKNDIVFGKSITVFKEFRKARYLDFEIEKPKWYLKRLPNHQAVFMPKALYKKIKYDTNLTISADSIWLKKCFDSGNNFICSKEVICEFYLGGKSNYYGSRKVFASIVKDTIYINKERKLEMIKSICKHSIKYFFQKALGKDKYLTFYIKLLKE